MKEYAGKILMISESPFPEDPRVSKEAFALTKAGYKVQTISRNYARKKNKEEINGVVTYRIPQLNIFEKSTLSKSYLGLLFYRITSSIGYIIEYFYFTFVSFFLSLYIVIKDGFDYIHIHNPPNTLVLIGIFYRILRKKYIFDHHDLAPELYLSKYNVRDGLFYRLLVAEEKLCLKLSNLVIATNESYKKIDMDRGGIKEDKIVIVRNGPDLNKFQIVPPDDDLKKMNKIILAYIGVMGSQDGVDYMLRALHYLVNTLKRKDFYCIIIGPGDAVDNLKMLAGELGVENYVRFTGFIPKQDLLRYLSTADICLDPNPSNPLNDHSTWIKVMEYMAFGKPVISFDLKETRFTAQNAALYVEPNDEKAFAKAIVRLMNNPDERKKMGEFGLKRVKEELAWQHVSKNLILGYESKIRMNSSNLNHIT
jgi:glycosyltransferase involved in cell wall biosynthesis